MKYLVTGGAGFIGSHFCDLLVVGLPAGDEVVILDKLGVGSDINNLKDVLHSRQVTFVKGDICNSDLTNELIKDVDVVINFAAESHVDRSILDPGSFISNNVLGTQLLLESARINPQIIFVQISTDEVYGPLETGEAIETTALNPSSPYSASKASADLVALSYYKTYGMDVRITRCANNFGLRQNSEKLIPLLISKITSNKPLPIYGNGRNIREWIHVKDHCRAIKTVIDRGKSGEIYNVGSNDRLTNLEVVDLLLSYAKNSTSEVEFVTDRLGHDSRYALDSGKIRRELGFSAEVQLINSIQELFEDYYLRRE
jgi:dTDP-glucose 4,6-dehydratase